jgi:hypothetical protein
MPQLNFVDDAHKRRAVALMGYDPDQFDVDPNSGSLFQRPQQTPLSPPVNTNGLQQLDTATTNPPPKPQNQFSPLASGAIGAASGVLPTAGGFGAAMAAQPVILPIAAATGPFAPATELGLSLAAGIGGGALVNKLQNYLLPKGIQENISLASQQNPKSFIAGNVASQLPFMAASPRNVLVAAKTLGNEAMNLLPGRAVNIASTPGQIANLKNVALAGGIPAGLSVAEDVTSGQDVNIPKALALGAAGTFINRPTALGQKLLRLPAAPEIEPTFGAKGDTRAPLINETTRPLNPSLADFAKVKAKEDFRAGQEAEAKKIAEDISGQEAASRAELRGVIRAKGEYFKGEQMRRIGGLEGNVPAGSATGKFHPSEIEAFNKETQEARRAGAERQKTIDELQAKTAEESRQARFQRAAVRAKGEKMGGTQMAVEAQPKITPEQAKAQRESNYQLYKNLLKSGDVAGSEKFVKELGEGYYFKRRYLAEKASNKAEEFPTPTPEQQTAETQQVLAERRKNYQKEEGAGLDEIKQKYTDKETQGEEGTKIRATKNFFDKFNQLFGGKRGVESKLNPELPVKGQIDAVREGLKSRLAEVNPNTASPDTLPHEFVHGWYEDLKQSSNRYERQTAKNLERAVESSPEFRAENNKRRAEGKTAIAPHEFMAETSGYEVFSRAVNLGKENGTLGRTWKDFVSRVKLKWGNAKAEDVSNFITKRFLNDPHYSDIIGEPGASVAKGKLNQGDEPKSKENVVRYYLTSEGKGPSLKDSIRSVVIDDKGNEVKGSFFERHKTNKEALARKQVLDEELVTNKQQNQENENGKNAKSTSEEGSQNVGEQQANRSGEAPRVTSSEQKGNRPGEDNLRNVEEGETKNASTIRSNEGQVRSRGEEGQPGLQRGANESGQNIRQPSKEERQAEFGRGNEGGKNEVPVQPLESSRPEVVKMGTSRFKGPQGDPLGTTYRATPEDWTRWQQLQKEGYAGNGPEWESIKNKYGGMPPEAPSGETKLSQPNEEGAGLESRDIVGGIKAKLESPEFRKSSSIKRGFSEIKQRLPVFGSELDKLKIRTGESGKTIAPAISEALAGADALEGKFLNPSITDWKGLSSKEAEGLYNVFLNEVKEGKSLRDKLSPAQQTVYDAERQRLVTKQTDQRAANQPVDEYVPNPDKPDSYKLIPRLPEVNPNYFPQIAGSKQLDIILNYEGSQAYNILKQDFVNHVKDNYKLTTDEANNLFKEYKASYGGPVPGNSTRFGAVRRAEGIGLPDSWVEPNPLVAMRRYWRRVAKDRSWYDAVESDPNNLYILGQSKDAWGHDVVPTKEGLNPLPGNKTFDSVMDSIQGVNIKTNPVIDASSRIANNLILGPLTGASDLLSALPIVSKFAPRFRDVPGVYMDAIKNIGEGIRNARSTGRIKEKTSDIEDIFFPSTDNVEKLRNLADGISKVTGRQKLEEWSRGLTQAAGESIIKIQKGLAESGNDKATKFLEGLSKDWTTLDNKELASRIVDITQGTYDVRGLPSWVTNSQVAPFFRLMKWNIEQLNNIHKHVIIPATKGELTPLLTTLGGGILGGYLTKEMREKVSGKKTQVPGIKEILASKGSTGDKLHAATYSVAAALSYSGVLGLLGEALKSAGDVSFKNKPQGLNYPLVEVLSDASDNLFDAIQAITQEGEDPLKVLPEFFKNLFSDNIQVAKILNNQVFTSKEEGSRKEANRDLRVFKQISGLPVAPQTVTQGDNKYLELESKYFNKETDLTKLGPEAVRLINKAVVKAKGNPDILKGELRKLKGGSTTGFPSPDENPTMFNEYRNYLNELVGPEETSRRVNAYGQERAIGKARRKLIPSI